MGFFNEKKRVSIAASPALSQEPLSAGSAGSAGSRHSGFAPSLSDLEKKDSKYKKLIRVLRFLTRLFSLLLNALMIAVLTWALYKYYTTRFHPISSSNSASAWVNPATLWPTFVLLGIAVATFFMNLFTLIAYCCSIRAANTVNTCSTVISYIFLGVHVLLWAIAAGAFKMGSNGKDLWGYTCSSQADKLAEEVKSFLNFGKLCQYQTGAWYISIIEAIIYLLTFIITILMLRRSASKKKLGRMRESMNMEAGYDRVELQTGGGGFGGYKRGTRYMPLAG
ncbi:uncharacterized protein PAC_08526 [Phialocephala subalpina]|uniref:MARVEL domain-containing protein n=1 Tax=Phialocephala subalpina TaxID=576137 RepID=A0A1L7X0T2_9HELO|nr:uncharacterized protein PAC_08526 [Phialocephala subalpina]